MVRYYYGTISGKFIFGVQSSYDAESFKEQHNYKPVQLYDYFGCNCNLQYANESYCHDCYSSYEDHYASLDEPDKSNIQFEEPIIFKTDIQYTFDNSELKYVTKQIEQIQNEIIKETSNEFNNLGISFIDKLKYEFDMNSDYYEYDIEIDFISSVYTDDKYNHILELIARWALGKQIQKALENCDECIINCQI